MGVTSACWCCVLAWLSLLPWWVSCPCSGWRWSCRWSLAMARPCPLCHTLHQTPCRCCTCPQVTIKSDNMDLAGDLVQELATYLSLQVGHRCGHDCMPHALLTPHRSRCCMLQGLPSCFQSQAVTQLVTRRHITQSPAPAASGSRQTVASSCLRQTTTTHAPGCPSMLLHNICTSHSTPAAAGAAIRQPAPDTPPPCPLPRRRSCSALRTSPKPLPASSQSCSRWRRPTA